MLKVTDRLYRGPRPTDFSALKALGITVAVDLEAGWYEALHPHAREEYNSGADANEIKVARFPLSDLFTPDYATVCRALNEVDSVLAANSAVYVHCLHGEDRTGYVCAAFRMSRMGWALASAVDEMLACGFHIFPYGFWVDSLKRFVKT